MSKIVLQPTGLFQGGRHCISMSPARANAALC